MMPRRLISVVLWLVLSACGQAAERPNVVVFLVDDLGWTDLGCYGSDLYQTPHIDRLAASGVRFTDAYSACARDSCASNSRVLMVATSWPVSTRSPSSPSTVATRPAIRLEIST